MEKLTSKGSKDKPAINFDNESGVLFLGGSSLPENVLEAYKPAMTWLDQYILDPNPRTTVEFFFEYLNTASSHMIMQILRKCLQLKETCEKLVINWYYYVGDLDMKDFGQELQEVTSYPINIIPKDSHM
jgi:hypothetical protein